MTSIHRYIRQRHPRWPLALWSLLPALIGLLGIQSACEDNCNQCTPSFQQCSTDGKFIELCQQDPISYCYRRAIRPCTQGTCVTFNGLASCQSCGIPCQPGAYQCQGNQLEVCELRAGSACAQFVTFQICSAGSTCDVTTRSCTGGTVTDGGPPPGCTRNNPTAKRGCVGNAIHWLDNCDTPTQKITDCQPGTQCTDGRCFAPCQSTCPQEGATQCQGTGVVNCEKAADGCVYWGKIQQCSSRKCTNGQCEGVTCPNLCPKLGEKKCDGTKVITCQMKAADCNEWSTPEDCPNGTGCVGGTCTPGGGCNNECGVGMTRCNGNNLETCMEDAKGCFLYDSGTPCPAGQVCANGSCQ